MIIWILSTYTFWTSFGRVLVRSGCFKSRVGSFRGSHLACFGQFCQLNFDVLVQDEREILGLGFAGRLGQKGLYGFIWLYMGLSPTFGSLSKDLG